MNSFIENHQETIASYKKNKWKILNKFMDKRDKTESSRFNNLGYHHLVNDQKISLLTPDETNRYPIQMYDHILQKADIYYKDLLEINSNKGGGAAYINKYYTPKAIVGIDSSSSNVNHCNAIHIEPGLKFIKGQYHNMPFHNESFDIVLSIESTKNFIDFSKSLDEIFRVLKSKGLFMFADTIETNNLETVKHYLRMAGFSIEQKQDITQNVIGAMEIDNNSNEDQLYNSFKSGKYKYMSFILRKVS